MKAHFDAAFDITMGHEGGFVNDPADRGGMTYRGISRKAHPKWPGWGIIDANLDRSGNLPVDVTNAVGLDHDVRMFYRVEFWRKFACDDLPQSIAAELFDSAVNCGPGNAVQFLQRALNILNRGGTSWPDLVPDGVYGGKTLSALKAALRDGDEAYVFAWMNIFQGMHYAEIARKDPSQERFTRGWLRRVALA